MPQRAAGSVVTQADLSAVMSAIPVAASSVPPSVSDTGSTGTGSAYALANHTHACKFRRGIASVSGNTVVWTYPTPFPAGVTPVCNATAQVASGDTRLVNAQIQGVPTNTQCTFMVTTYQQSVVSLIGLTVLSTAGTPFSGNMHMIAFEP